MDLLDKNLLYHLDPKVNIQGVYLVIQNLWGALKNSGLPGTLYEIEKNMIVSIFVTFPQSQTNYTISHTFHPVFRFGPWCRIACFLALAALCRTPWTRLAKAQ